MDIDYIRSIALSFPEATEEPHFEKTSFRVIGKIFATYNAAANRATVKLSEIDQNVFSVYDPTAVYPVPNKWGKQGWTNIELTLVKQDVLIDLLTTAYCTVAPAKLSALINKR